MKRKLVFICLMGILVTLTVNAQPKIVAHRGYWDIEGSAQNSIRALIKADSIQCDACEFDVWLTADKKLVVNHDDHINGYVIETTSSDTILNQKLKNGEYLPSLDQFLDVAKRLTIDLVLEIKPHKNREHEKEAVKMILDLVKAKELETKIEPRLLQSFKRIRKNSRNGLGIVYVQRDACGGCFNKIPPQRQLDIRSRKKVIVCEYCGRIMIDPELAGVEIAHKVEEAPAPTTKRAIRRKTAE